jgi:hypothetical protein
MCFWVISGNKKKRPVVFNPTGRIITLFYCFFLVQISRLPVGFIQQATTNQTNCHD